MGSEKGTEARQKWRGEQEQNGDGDGSGNGDGRGAGVGVKWTVSDGHVRQ